MDTERRYAASYATMGGKLGGIVAPFNTETRIGDFCEVIKPGAFVATLAAGRDILAVQDHDLTRVLGRTKNATLRLSEEARGLAFELDLPDTTTGRDVLAMAKRGDLGGMSFAFHVAPDGERWSGERRELLAVELVEVSVVSSWPAYGGTSVTARSRQTPFPVRLTMARRFMETIR